MQIISKELFGAVLQQDVHELEMHGNNIKYSHDYESEEDGEIVYIETWSLINIYELAHKCKEWAFSKERFVESAYCVKGNFSSSYAIVKSWDRFEILHKQHSDTEHEAIFKACEWILSQRS